MKTQKNTCISQEVVDCFSGDNLDLTVLKEKIEHLLAKVSHASVQNVTTALGNLSTLIKDLQPSNEVAMIEDVIEVLEKIADLPPSGVENERDVNDKNDYVEVEKHITVIFVDPDTLKDYPSPGTY